MSDPRDDVSLKGVNGPRGTFKIDASTITYEVGQPNGTSHAGKAVTLSGDNVVALAGDGEQVEGGLISVSSDGFCSVENHGGVVLPGGAGASLTNGKAIVGDLDGSGNKGYIREVATGTAAELGVARGRIVDNSVTTAVVVMFD